MTGSAFSRSRRVHWGECSPSGAVFYPIYFHWFDEAAWDLFESLKLPINDLGRRYGVVGMPLTGCGCDFRRPVRLGDDVQIVSRVQKVEASEIHLVHVVQKGEEDAVRAWETRFWGVKHPTHPERLQRGIIPDDVRAILCDSMARESKN